MIQRSFFTLPSMRPSAIKYDKDSEYPSCPKPQNGHLAKAAEEYAKDPRKTFETANLKFQSLTSRNSNYFHGNRTGSENKVTCYFIRTDYSSSEPRYESAFYYENTRQIREEMYDFINRTYSFKETGFTEFLNRPIYLKIPDYFIMLWKGSLYFVKMVFISPLTECRDGFSVPLEDGIQISITTDVSLKAARCGLTYHSDVNVPDPLSKIFQDGRVQLNKENRHEFLFSRG